MTETTLSPLATQDTRNVWQALWRGLLGRCPRCGSGGLFRRYLQVADRCPTCALDLQEQRADDAPPYIVLMIVGHLVVPAALMVETAFQPALWVHAALWAAPCLLLPLWLLPRAKGAMVGLQWALRMHGFGAAPAESAD